MKQQLCFHAVDDDGEWTASEAKGTTTPWKRARKQFSTFILFPMSFVLHTMSRAGSKRVKSFLARFTFFSFFTLPSSRLVCTNNLFAILQRSRADDRAQRLKGLAMETTWEEKEWKRSSEKKTKEYKTIYGRRISCQWTRRMNEIF